MTAAAIRTATSRDRSFVRSLSGTAFARFGRYESVLPRMVGASGVHTFIAEVEGTPCGFAMVEVVARAGWLDADLVAIAVRRESRGEGIGRMLLAHAEQFVSGLTHGAGAMMRLCVADDNAPARSLFESGGFEVSDPLYGWYPGGQRTIAMVKRIR